MEDLKCLECGEAGGVCLNAGDGDTFRCLECDSEFTRADARERVGAWLRVLEWADTHLAHKPATVRAAG